MGGVSAYAAGRRRSYGQTAEAALLLLAELQHRGQETTGVAALANGGRVSTVKARSPALRLLRRLLGFRKDVEREAFGCVAHAGDSTPRGSAQPVVFGNGRSRIALAFDGGIPDYRDAHSLAARLAPDLVPSHAPGDSHALAQLVYALAREEKWDFVEALRRLPEYVSGAYSLVLLTSEPRLVMARDPGGFRPLAYSYGDGEVYVASETSALDSLDLEWREVGFGEVVSFDGGSLEVAGARVPAEPSPCVFEYVYMSRPDSYFNGVSVYTSRLRLGERLARVAPVDADAIVPVPDSGRVAAVGYSRSSGIPLVEGIVVNKYVGRVFISSPGERDLVSRLKHGVVRPAVEGRRIVVVDDSIVRGTTLAPLMGKLRRAGARELHFRVSSPPFRCPCYMGVNVASGEELLAWGRSSAEEVGRMLGADSLAYNTLENLELSVGLPRVCSSCFTCSYAHAGASLPRGRSCP